MGDVIELTTWPKHKNIFYKLTSGALNFEVKGFGNAAVGLAKELGTKCVFWIILDHNRRCWITKINNNSHSVSTPNILTTDEYRRFWITWTVDHVSLGRDGDAEAIIQYKSGFPDLKYVTFCVLGDRNPVHWKFELPPLLKQPVMKTISNGKMRWVSADTQLPDDALIGGHESEFLYIIRAEHGGSLTPGKFVPSQGLGYIPWGGSAHDKSEFEVLCGIDCVWVETSDGQIPSGALESGYSENNRETLYVGRASYKGHIIPGKVQPSHKVCYIPFDNREQAVKNYEILTVPDNNSPTVNKVLVPHVDVDIDVDIDDAPSSYSQHSDEEEEDDNINIEYNNDDNFYYVL